MLAEFLITLGIIGMVAALTMPVLVANYQKRVVVERLKKVYTTMKQVETMAITDNGDIESWAVSWYPRGDKILLNNYILPYVDAVKVCIDNECPYKYTESSTVEKDLTSSPGFYLKDGTLIKISEYHIGYNWDTSSLCGTYLIDINGGQKPNKVGRDVFFAWFMPGGDSSSNQLTLFYFIKNAACYRVTDGKFRTGCYRKIVEDGWQIKNDYPWNF